jgi:hypothetical protein
MTPKKVWVEHNIRNFDGLSEVYKNGAKTYKQLILDVSDIETSDKAVSYILESEHNRIVDELKKEVSIKIDVEIEDLEFRIHRLELAIHNEMSYPNPQPEHFDNIEGWIHERMVCKEKLATLMQIK